MDAGLNQTRMQMLGEFAELALVLARDLQQSALCAEDAETKVRHAEAFHRVGRGLRQSLALHAKFERDAELSIHEAAAREAKRDRQARAARKADIKGQVDALVWTEREKLDFDLDDSLEAVDQILDAEAETERFLDTDPQVFVRRLCKALKLDPTQISDRHGRACPGHPETPTVQDDRGGPAGPLTDSPVHLGSRDKPGNDEGGEEPWRSSA